MADINKIRRQQVIIGEQSVIAGLIAKGLVQPIDAETIKKDCEECERVQEEKSKPVELRLAVVSLTYCSLNHFCKYQQNSRICTHDGKCPFQEQDEG